LDKLFDAGSFDIVLCHNVIQYVDEAQPLLELLARMIKPGGFLSLITTNQHSLPYQAALLDGDLDKAYTLLDQSSQHNFVFDVDVRAYRPDEVFDWLAAQGLETETFYGIRCLYHFWKNNDLEEGSDTYVKLKRLEMELAERDPYRQTARQFQVIARKPQA
jgi:S-adenosylmethionine-dependent methyltransferase